MIRDDSRGPAEGPASSFSEPANPKLGVCRQRSIRKCAVHTIREGHRVARYFGAGSIPVSRPRPSALVVSALLAVVVLAGCTAAPGGTPSDAATPGSATSPTAPTAPDAESSPYVSTGIVDTLPRLVAAPASAADAVIAARAAVEDYNNLWNDIRNDADLDPLSITAVASDQGASVVVAEMQNLASEKILSSGTLGYGISTAVAGPADYRDGTNLPFGSVEVSGCMDASGISTINADGSAAEVSDVTSYVWDYTVLYGAEQGSWFVVKSALPAVPVAC